MRSRAQANCAKNLKNGLEFNKSSAKPIKNEIVTTSIIPTPMLFVRKSPLNSKT